MVVDCLFNRRLVCCVLFLVGLFGIVDALYLMVRYQIFHLGVVLPFVIGVIFCVHGFFWQRIFRFLQLKAWLKRIWIFCWVGFFVWLLSFFIFVFYLQTALNNQQNSVNKPVKAIIVLGSGFRKGKPTPVLAERLDKSATIAKKNPDALLVLTGGIGFNKTVSEASVMSHYLQDKFGLSADKMALEDKSTSTELNLQNSKQILIDYAIMPDNLIVVVTSDFHTLRALAIAKKIGFTNVTALGAVTPLYIRYNNWLREYFAFVSGWLLNEY